MFNLLKTKTYGDVTVRVSFTVSSKQDNLFTGSHTKYDAVVRNLNNGISKRFSYQCNSEKPPKAEDLLYCLILDGDYFDNINSFEDYLFEFGYITVDVKDLRKHKKNYKKFIKQIKKFTELFNEKEVKDIRQKIGDNLLV